MEKSDWPHRAGRVTRRFHKHNDHPNRSNFEREADGAARMEKHVSIVLRFLDTQADSIRKSVMIIIIQKLRLPVFCRLIYKLFSALAGEPAEGTTGAKFPVSKGLSVSEMPNSKLRRGTLS